MQKQFEQMEKNMKTRTLTFFILLFLLVGCGGADTAEVISEVESIVDQDTAMVETIIEEVEVIKEVEVEKIVEVQGEQSETAALEDGDSADLTLSRTSVNRSTERLIIKQGNMTLEVADPDRIVNTTTDIIVSKGGYIINQSIYSGENGFRYATLRLAVPVDQFEATTRALRELGTVLFEEASGQDVTEEFVDLNSKLDNLIATQERLRGFLDDSTSVEEALDVNRELRTIEEELNVIQGRIAFLTDRAAFSTIDLQVNPIVPTPTPRPTSTPTPTPTPVPTATPAIWKPGETARQASAQLQRTAENTADGVIYSSIVCLPWVLIAGVLFLIGYRVYRTVEKRHPVSFGPAARIRRASDGSDSAEKTDTPKTS